MWTHLVPYLGDDKTAETIQRVTRIGLWRAINLGRLIVFTGSGVTRYHQQPSWRNILQKFVQLTLEEYLNPSSEQETNSHFQAPPEQQLIADQIILICTKGAPDNVISIYSETAENASGQYYKVNSEHIDAENESLLVAVDLCEELLIKMGKGHSGLSRLKTVRLKFAELFQPRNLDMNEYPPRSGFEEIKDPIDAIFRYTRTRRILTTNYDTEIERWVYKSGLLDSAEDEELEQFRRILEEKADDTGEKPGTGTEKPPDQKLTKNPDAKKAEETRQLLKALTPVPRRITAQNALARKIVSSSLDSTNVGDLLNFAAYSRSYKTQIFHLHGRHDRPEDMIVSQRDYRRIYADDPRSDQAFQSAQEVLFAGNDVLMIGFGLTEHDLLQPFRQFVVRGRTPSHAPRRTFALLPTHTCESFERKNSELAVKYALNYEIYTLFYGGPVYRNLINALNVLKKGGLDTEERDKHISQFNAEKNSEAGKKLIPDRVDIQAGDVDTLDKIDTLSSAIQTGAMILELADLNRLSRDWWDVWRHSPLERKAKYHVAASEIAGLPNYLYVRHCMESGITGTDDNPEDWNCLKQAREIALKQFSQKLNLKNPKDRKNDNEKERKFRILRLTMERGGGKGTLARLLHHEKNQKYIFGLSEPGQKYRAAFIAHLSFSMEFTSVLEAFSRFFAIQLARWINEYILEDDIEKTRGTRWDFTIEHFPEKRKIPANSNSPDMYHENFLSLVRKTLSELQHIASIRDDADFERILRDILRARSQGLEVPARIAQCRDIDCFINANFSAQELYQAARAISVARWEDNQNLIDRFFTGVKDKQRTESPGKHRLDVLRHLMSVYEIVAPEARLFVCLSSLERIVDVDGDSYNPAHRAFFRLLTDREERAGVDAPRPPVDLVLISGRPDAPICYLSDEMDADNIQPGDMKKYSRLSKTGRILRKWNILEVMDWDSRTRVLGYNPDRNTETKAGEAIPDTGDIIADTAKESLPDRDEAMSIFLKWAKGTDSTSSGHSLTHSFDSRRIHRLLSANSSLSLWVMQFWCRQREEKEENGQSPAPTDIHDFIRDLDAAAARNGLTGVMDYLLRRYHLADQFAGVEKSPANSTQQTGMVDPELNRLVLRHLALFALPVEAWVLLGCPKIYDHLNGKYLELYQKSLAKYRAEHQPHGNRVPDQDVQQIPLKIWHARTWMLHRLKNALDTLQKRGLVLLVRPAADSTDTKTGSDEHFLHVRYSLHNLMREHLVRIMRLAVHDGANLNHHRMSIYCDQPRDLPTPTERHFELIRDILNRQTEFCRKTLFATYQHSREGHYVRERMKNWDPETVNVDAADGITSINTANITPSHMAAERVYAPYREKPESPLSDTVPVKDLYDFFEWSGSECYIRDWNNPSGIGGALGHVHAVPQRLRAMLSLMQGSFSIGSLSRLKIAPQHPEAETPFDAYRNWLSKLLNIATSLERTREEIGNVFCERLLQGDTPDDKTGWLEKALNDPELQKSRSDRYREYEFATGDEKRIRDAARKIGFLRRQRTSYPLLRHPYYRDEIAWLYNERGLTSLTRGLLFDAIPLFEQALFLMSHKKTAETDTHAYHAAERRIRLNYSIAQLERGNVNRARIFLEELRDSSLDLEKTTPSEILLFSNLYIAVCDHLSGGHQLARDRYEIIIQEFSRKKKLRAVALSNRFLAELLHTQGDHDYALIQADMAVRAASQSEQRDVEHLALVTKSKVEIELRRFNSAHNNIIRALNYSKALGLFSIEIDARLAYAALMNRQGDFELAGQYSSEAIALAVKNGLRIRKLEGLVCFAETRMARGSVDFARRILLEVIREAESLGCLTIASKSIDMLSGKDHDNI